MNLKFHLLFIAAHIATTVAYFDCETVDPSGVCPQLKCVYDEVYSAPVRTCTCKVALEVISLSENTLRSDIFGKICSLRKERLERLVINDIELEIIDDKIFDEYNNLKYLDLAKNKVVLNFTRNARQLVELDVSFNQIEILERDVFKNLQSLQILNASFNRIREIDSVLKGLNNLEEIYLNNNQLISVANNEFGNLEKLKVLNLAHNFLSTIGNNLPSNLQELYLNDNKITTINKNDFASAPKLKILNLARNAITTIQTVHQIAKRAENSEGQNFYNYLSRNLYEQQKPVVNQNFFDANKYPWSNTQNFNNFLLNSHKNLPTNPFTTNFLNQNQKQVFAFQPNQADFSKLGNEFTLLGKSFANRLKSTIQGSNTIIPQTTIWGKMQELNLAQNNIRQLPDDFLNDLRELRSLNLSYNALINFDLNKVDSQKLRVLDLKGNFLDEVDLQVAQNKWPLLKIIDVDLSSLKCEKLSQVLDYFIESGVILKSCGGVIKCCGKVFG